MQALKNIAQLKSLKTSQLPKRVAEEIFPLFQRYIQKEYHIAIGVSSGVDSMCLSNLLILRYRQKKYPLSHIHIIHCNHKFRTQSEQEERYIQQYFEGANIHISHRNKKEKSDENSLRNRRYQCFDHVMQENNISLLFLGHHLEDRIESTFFNTMR